MSVIARHQKFLTARGRRSNGGYTLLEVLIAAIVLAIGLVGVASLQVGGSRLNNSAYLRTQASIMAYDIVDRMRANIPGARNGDYDITLADPAPGGATVPNIDLRQWRNLIAYYLPQGTASIERIAGPSAAEPSRFTITVEWNDGRAPADLVQFVVTTDI
ncbi:MAG: type IV pilus modification protein PilV [Pseudomonadota bacterium]